MRALLFVILLIQLPHAYAELEALDDKALEKQKGQAGITIDLEFKLSIGEIAYQYTDKKPGDKLGNFPGMPPAPERIQYVLPKK